MNMKEKIAKLIYFVQELLQQPSLVNEVTNSKIVRKKQFYRKNPGVELLPQVSLWDFADKDEFEIPNYTFLGGGSLPTDMALLRAACEKFDSCRYFEIGTWRGESAINVVDLTSICHTLNLSEEEMRAMGLEESYIQLQGILSKVNEDIVHLYGNSAHFDFAGLNQKYDVIFIDGSHFYEDVLSDTKKVFAHLVHENSIVIWHDYAYSPEEVRYEVYQAIWDALEPEYRKNLYHVANTLSAVFFRGNLPTKKFEPLVNPQHFFQVKLSVHS